jgi:hypothetical protein
MSMVWAETIAGNAIATTIGRTDKKFDLLTVLILLTRISIQRFLDADICKENAF